MTAPVVHYLLGATMATLYGMAAEWSDRVYGMTTELVLQLDAGRDQR
jgi:hypothetical protein